MKNNFLAFFILAAIAFPAMADNTGTFYIAGDLGSASYTNMGPFPNPGVFRIAGGFNITPNWAMEVGYSKFGDSTVTVPGYGSATVTASSFQFAAIGILPVTTQFDVIGKLGIADNKETDSVTITGTVNVSADFSQRDLLIGIGAQFHVSSQLSIRVLYDDYGKFDDYSSPMKASSISLGVVYNFQ